MVMQRWLVGVDVVLYVHLHYRINFMKGLCLQEADSLTPSDSEFMTLGSYEN